MHPARFLFGFASGFVALVGIVALGEHRAALRGWQWLERILPFGIATDRGWLALITGVSIALTVAAWWGLKSPRTTFVLQAPPAEGEAPAGPVLLKGANPAAYAGFATRALARLFILRAGLSEHHAIVPLAALGNTVPLPYPHAAAVLRLDSRKALEEYFAQPSVFAFGKHVVPLGPVAA